MTAPDPAPAPGLCGCGCGERPPLATRTDRARGWVRGEPRPYVLRHGHRRSVRGVATARRARSTAGLAPAELAHLVKIAYPDPAPSTLTGHEAGDRILPAVQQLIGAVRDGDRRAARLAVDEARRDAAHPDWMWVLLCTLAALVPDDQPLTQLLAWTQPAPAPTDDDVDIPTPRRRSTGTSRQESLPHAS